MNCTDARRLMHGYLDGELDLVRSIEVEGHLADCGGCLSIWNAQRDLKESIRADSLRFDSPKGLEKRIRRAVSHEQKRDEAQARRSRPIFFKIAQLAFGAAAIGIVFVLGWNIVHSNPGDRVQNIIAEDVVSDHIRSLMADHLFDVASTDQHTVKPWFTGKLDFSPPVVDLADKGFPLAGGRLDYLTGQPVSALVYHRRKHILNLFIWPASIDNGRRAPQTETRRGYNVSHWSIDGMTFYAVSDVSAGDLSTFARLMTEPAVTSGSRLQSTP